MMDFNNKEYKEEKDSFFEGVEDDGFFEGVEDDGFMNMGEVDQEALYKATLTHVENKLASFGEFMTLPLPNAKRYLTDNIIVAEFVKSDYTKRKIISTRSHSIITERLGDKYELCDLNKKSSTTTEEKFNFVNVFDLQKNDFRKIGRAHV